MFGGVAAVIVGTSLIPLIALLAIVIIPGRHDRDDNSGRKVYAKFLLVVIFLFVFLGMFSAYGVTHSLTGLIHNGGYADCGGAAQAGPSSGSFFCHRMNLSQSFGVGGGQATSGDRAARGTVLFGLLFLVSLAVVWMEGHAAARLFSSKEVIDSSPGRVLDAYLFSTSFVALVVFVLAAVGAIYALFAVLGPGTFGQARGAAAQQLISGGVLAVIADAVLFWHVRRAWKLHAAPADDQPRTDVTTAE